MSFGLAVWKLLRSGCLARTDDGVGVGVGVGAGGVGGGSVIANLSLRLDDPAPASLRLQQIVEMVDIPGRVQA